MRRSLPVRGLFCRFFMPIPASASKKQRALMEGCAVPHTKKPDLDNLIKFVKDCANGILWDDDSQVTAITAAKAYYPHPATEIQVYWEATEADKMAEVCRIADSV
jgi:Holliday junction resolvase RusA-like endonuclease